MDREDDTLHRIIADLTYKNEQLEYKIEELESELRQSRTTIRIYCNKLTELNEVL
jgi:response regulator of citrate/malate metabolism